MDSGFRRNDEMRAFASDEMKAFADAMSVFANNEMRAFAQPTMSCVTTT